MLNPLRFSQQDISMLWPIFSLSWIHVIDWNKCWLLNKYFLSLPQSLASHSIFSCSKMHIPPPWHFFEDQHCRWNCEILIYSKATKTYAISKYKQTSFGKGCGGAAEGKWLPGAGCRIPQSSQSPALAHTLCMHQQQESRKRVMKISDRRNCDATEPYLQI